MKDYFQSTFDYNYDDEFYPQDSSLFKFYLITLEAEDPLVMRDLSDSSVKSFEVSDKISLGVKRLILRQGTSAYALPTPEIGTIYKFSCSYYFNRDMLKLISSLYSSYGIDNANNLSGFGKCQLLAEVHFYKNRQDSKPIKIMQYKNVNVQETSGITFDTTGNNAVQITNTFVADELNFIKNKDSVALNPSGFKSSSLKSERGIVESDASTGDIQESLKFNSIAKSVKGLFSTDSLPEAFKTQPAQQTSSNGISVKANVGETRITENVARALPTVKSVFDEAGAPLTITSASEFYEGRPGITYHSTGDAIDIRANTLKKPNGTEFSFEEKRALRSNLDKELNKNGKQFDVLLHGHGSNLHIHIEYDQNQPNYNLKQAKALGNNRFNGDTVTVNEAIKRTNKYSSHHEHDGHRHIDN